MGGCVWSPIWIREEFIYWVKNISFTDCKEISIILKKRWFLCYNIFRGKEYERFNEVIVDLCYQEDSNAQVDSNVILTKSGKIVDFQTTSEGEPYEYEKMLEYPINIKSKNLKMAKILL